MGTNGGTRQARHLVQESQRMTTRLLGEVDLHTRQLGLVNGILSAVLDGASFPDVLKIFYSNLKTLCPIDRMSVSKYDAKRRLFLIPLAIKSGRLVETREEPRPYDETPLSEVVASKVPVLRKDIRRRKSYTQDTQFLQKGFESEMLFPLISGGEVFGTFQVGCFDADRLKERHLRLVSEILPAITLVMKELIRKDGDLFV